MSRYSSPEELQDDLKWGDVIIYWYCDIDFQILRRNGKKLECLDGTGRWISTMTTIDEILKHYYKCHKF